MCKRMLLMTALHTFERAAARRALQGVLPDGRLPGHCNGVCGWRRHVQVHHPEVRFPSRQQVPFVGVREALAGYAVVTSQSL